MCAAVFVPRPDPDHFYVERKDPNVVLPAFPLSLFANDPGVVVEYF